MATLLGPSGCSGSVIPADRAANGDRDLGRLLDEHRIVARRALRAVLGRCQEEEDLLQEVTIRLLRRLNQPGEFALSAWTWRVAHNVAVDYIRKHRAVPVEDANLDRGVGNGLDDEVIASQLDAALWAAMQRLPDRQRDALLASAALDGGRGRHGLIAARLGVSHKAAESLLARARVTLWKELKAEGAVAVVVTAAALLRRTLRRKVVVAGVLAVAAVTAVTAVIEMRVLPVTPDGGSRRPAAGAPAVSRLPRVGPGVDPAGESHGPSRNPPVSSPPSQAASVQPPTRTGTGQPAGAPGPLTAPSVTVPTLPGMTVTTLPGVTVTLPPVSLPPLPGVTLPKLPSVTVTTLPSVTVPTLPSVPLPGAPTTPSIPHL